MVVGEGSVNIEEIMKSIRSDISHRYSQEEVLSFEAVSLEDTLVWLDPNVTYDETYCEEKIIECQSNSNIEWYRPIEGNVLVVFVKKVIRKLNTFLVGPIAEDQTCLNNNLVEVVNQLFLRAEMQDKKIAQLESMLKRD